MFLLLRHPVAEDLSTEQPAYLQPTSLPVIPNRAPDLPAAPAQAQEQKTDEYGLPVDA